MEMHRKVLSGPGSQVTVEDYSVMSPNKSTYSGNTYHGMAPTFNGYPKAEHYDHNHQYFPNIVQDLISGKEEWRNIQDIVKMTLKAL